MIRCIIIPHLDPAARREELLPDGWTLAEIVRGTLPAAPPARVRLVIVGDDEGHVVDRDWWHRTRPKPGITVVVRVVMSSGAMRAVLSVAAAIAAMAIAGPLLAPFGALVQNIGTAALVIGSQLLINALIPLPKQSSQQTDDVFAINGFKNEYDPNGYVPAVAGKIRWAPPYAASPWTDASGFNDRFITAAFNLGYGPQVIREPRIGDTPITKYKRFEIETFEGTSSDGQMTLYPRQVVEDQQSIRLSYEDHLNDRDTTLFTKIDGTAFSFDLSFAQGLYAMTTGDKPKQISMPVGFTYSYRPAGSEDEGDWVDVDTVIMAKSTQPIVRTIYQDLPARGQYEIKWARTTPDYDELDASVIGFAATSRSDLTALRTFRPEYPIAFTKPIALIDVNIKGTDQLNGTLDNFSVESSMIALDYDHVTGTWSEGETSNPASVFRWFATGPMNPKPWDLGDDLSWLEDWHDYCRTKELTCKGVYRDEASIDDRMADIAACGRAVPQDFGAARGVIIDRPRTIVAGHITARNSWGFEWEQNFSTLPDAFRIKFLDETNDFEQAERIVPLPGFTGGEPVFVESLDIPRGVTHPDQVWRYGRWRGYEALYRRRRYTIYQDLEHLTCMRGDMVKLSHFVLSRTMVGARVKQILTLAGGTMIRLDEQVSMEEGQSYAIRFRLSDGSSVLHEVVTQPGATTTIRLADSSDLPEEGDLALFGLAEEESIEAIILDVEMQDDLSARLTLTDHAPEIETLTDAETPPVWTGRVGEEAGASTVAPGAPIITAVESGLPAPLADRVVVSLAPGTGATPPQIYEVDHRLTGAGAWTTLSILAAAGGVQITGYTVGDALELRARAQGANGLWSAYTATVTHTVQVEATDAVDGQDPVVLADFSRGSYEIDGQTVLAASIISARSGVAKVVVGATGEPETIPATSLALDYSTGRRRLLAEGAATNLFIGSAAPTAAQDLTITAQAYTISFWGSGTLTLSGAASTPLAGTDASTRATLTVTPAAGTLTLTPSGAVSRVQVEVGSLASSYVETTSAAVTRVADAYTVAAATRAKLSPAGPNTLAWRGDIRTLVASQPVIGMTAGNLVQGHSSNAGLRLAGAATNIGISGAILPANVGLCIAWDGAGRLGSTNASVPVSDTTALTYAMDGLSLPRPAGMAVGTRHEIDALVIWSVKGSTAAVKSQARTWA